MSFSPTQLNVLTENCAYALELYKQERKKRDTDEDPEVAEVDGPQAAEFGIIAHACLYAAALAEKAGKPRNEAVEATALVLTRKYSPKIVRAAADHALDFIFDWKFDKDMDYEHGVAFDEHWKECTWDDEHRMFRLIFDVVGVKTISGDEEYGELTLACAEDYKTGFGAGPDDLDGIQSLAFTKTLRRLYPDVDGIRVNFIATRWKGQYERTWIFENDDDAADLARRDARLEFFLNAAKNADGKPRVGYGCSRCRNTQKCEAFKALVKEAVIGKAVENPERAAAAMVALETRAKEIKVVLKEVTKDGPIQCGSRLLGHHPTADRVPVNPERIVELWFKIAGFEDTEGAAEVTHGLVSAMDAGVGNIDNVIKKIAKARGVTQKVAKEEYGPKFFTTVKGVEFGWTKAE